MNSYLKILFLVLFTQVSFSQIYEVGFTFGKSNFIGDVGSTTFINPNENLFGGVFKWNRSPRHSYRISYVKSTLAADDLDSSDPRRIERGYNFETPINEISLGMEFNFLISTFMILIYYSLHIYILV